MKSSRFSGIEWKVVFCGEKKTGDWFPVLVLGLWARLMKEKKCQKPMVLVWIEGVACGVIDIVLIKCLEDLRKNIYYYLSISLIFNWIIKIVIVCLILWDGTNGNAQFAFVLVAPQV